MRLSVLTQDAVDQLASDVPAIAGALASGSFKFEEYFDDESDSWSEEVEFGATFPATLELPSAGEGLAEADARISRRFFETTASLKRSEATDARLWVTLSLTSYYPYVLGRFFADVPPIEELEPHQLSRLFSRIKRHLLYGGPKATSRMFENAVARLWWLAETARDPDVDGEGDPLHLLPALLTSERFAMVLCGSQLSSNRDIVLGILDAVERFKAKGLVERGISRFLDEHLVRYLNDQEPVMVFDFLGREEMATYCLDHLVASV